MKLPVPRRTFGRQASVFPAIALHTSRKPLRWFAVLFLIWAAVLAAPLAAQAQTNGGMLFLSTSEGPPSNLQTININNAWDAFKAQALIEGLKPVDGRTWLSNPATFSIPEDTKLIVIVTGYNRIDPAPMAELQDVIENNPNLAVVIFSESCSSKSEGVLTPRCSRSQQNLQDFMAAVDTIQPQPPAWPQIELSTGNPGNYTAHLNMSSLYASTFSDAGLRTLTAGNYTPLTNVPLNYALYTQAALPASPPAIVTQNVVGLFIPQTVSNKGQGACLFLTADASEFTDSHPEQYAPIASAFTTAALDPNGACAQPAAGAPDLWPTLSGLTSLDVGSPATVILTVSNADQAPSGAATEVIVTLPDGIALSGPPPDTCWATAPGFTCPIPVLDKSEILSFPFQIIAQDLIASTDGEQITAEVKPVPGEINTGNNIVDLPIVAPGHVDLGVAISGMTNRSVVDSSQAYWVTVTNVGNLQSDDGTVTVTLPANMTVDSLPSNCEETSATSFACTLKAIAPGDGVTIAFTATTTKTFNNQLIKVQLTGVSGDDDPDNDSADIAISAVTEESSSVQPIPALGSMALALLALMTAGGAAAHLRRKG
jgi:hypothetical protein